MTAYRRSSRWPQIVGWAFTGLFVLGFFLSAVGEWTGPILGVWFVGTQKPRRGFLWLMLFAFVPSLIANWSKFPLTGPAQALGYLGWLLLAALLGVLPLVFHRLVSPHLQGFLSTLPFPLAAVAIPAVALSLHITAASAVAIPRFLVFWFAAIVVWMWNREFRASKMAVIAGFFAAVYIVAAGFHHIIQLSRIPLPPPPPASSAFHWICLAAALALSVWARLRLPRHQSWAERPQAVALLQSPYTGNPVHIVAEQGQESLVSTSGERFPIRDGIPAFLKPEDLTGDNLKYNHLYETIGGFYDDIQRVFCVLKGFDRDAYFRSYMSMVEAQPGDSVLETSVGTGLNFKYLPRDLRLSGLDLSPEMLANCQDNLRRWDLDADLYLGNAESLPFADSSFDVVFHVGGINFFNDRAKAIREMIRVAKPGSRLLIADETEKHVKEVYEKGLGPMYKNRKQPVSAPVELVPPEMQEIHLEQMRDGEWYVLTFRKPAIA